MDKPREFQLACPAPRAADAIVMAHGGGGLMMHRLLEEIFLPAFSNPALDARHDGAVLQAAGATLAFSTDSYVVTPHRFPGGDIGTLAVNGTVNDLAMCGARPLWLSAGFILQEGFPLSELRRVVESMREAAGAAGVQIVTGDVKVVERGHADGIYINTSGVGLVESPVPIGPSQMRAGDAVIVSGDLGRHGIAVMAVREGLRFDGPVESDCAPLWGLVESLLQQGVGVHALRDLTRGGLATAVCELAASARLGVELEERLVPVDEAVRGACELLGLDPLYVANEGRCVAVVDAKDADRALELMRRQPCGRGAARIGRVVEDPASAVTMMSLIGAPRLVEMLSGEQLPRIC